MHHSQSRMERENAPVFTVCQPIEKGVLACTMYMVMVLWLSGPGPQDSFTVVSAMSVTDGASGAPGGPITVKNSMSLTAGKQCQSQAGFLLCTFTLNHSIKVIHNSPLLGAPASSIQNVTGQQDGYEQQGGPKTQDKLDGMRNFIIWCRGRKGGWR